MHHVHVHVYGCTFCISEVLEKCLYLWQTESFLWMTTFGILRIWKVFCGLDFLSLLNQMLKIAKSLRHNINTGEADSAVILNLEPHTTSCFVLRKGREECPEMSPWLYKTKDDWGYFDWIQKTMRKRGQQLRFNEEDEPNIQMGRFIHHHHHRPCKWGKPATLASPSPGMFTSAGQNWRPVWIHLLSWPLGHGGLQII